MNKMNKMNKCDQGAGMSNVSINEDTREIFVFGEINSNVALQVVYALRAFDAQCRKNIFLVMNSKGGSEGAGWAIFDALRLTKSKVIGQFFGECMSIAALILQGCDTRLLAGNCRVMIHNGTISFESMAQEKVKNVNKEIEIMTQAYYNELSQRSHLTLDKIKKLCDNETYMSADSAVEFGFADGVLGLSKGKA